MSIENLDDDFIVDPIEEEYAKVFNESKKMFDDDDFYDAAGDEGPDEENIKELNFDHD
jgi:hypothetical protein